MLTFLTEFCSEDFISLEIFGTEKGQTFYKAFTLAEDCDIAFHPGTKK